MKELNYNSERELLLSLCVQLLPLLIKIYQAWSRTWKLWRVFSSVLWRMFYTVGRYHQYFRGMQWIPLELWVLPPHRQCWWYPPKVLKTLHSTDEWYSPTELNRAVERPAGPKGKGVFNGSKHLKESLLSINIDNFDFMGPPETCNRNISSCYLITL